MSAQSSEIYPLDSEGTRGEGLGSSSATAGSELLALVLGKQFQKVLKPEQLSRQDTFQPESNSRLNHSGR